MNTDLKNYEILLNVSRITTWALADICLGEKENMNFWHDTKIYNSLRDMSFKVYCYNDNAKLIKNFVSEVKAHEAELDALYNASRAELDARLAKKKEEKERRRLDEEAFAKRWYGCQRAHFSGKYMKYVHTVDDLRANTWTEFNNKYIIKVIEDADYDYSYYAKSYGHPKKTVNSRYVRICKHGTGLNAGHVVCAKELEIESFRQNNILQAIADFFEIAKPAKNKLQTNPFYNIKKITKNLFCQKFGKQVVGYVAVNGDICYHSSTKDGAIYGLSQKMELLKRQEEKEAGTNFTASKLHKEFGFCWQGMREFVESAGLDINKKYTLKELKDAVKCADKNVVLKYKKELKAIHLI